jgi:hypothetical protein
MHDQQLIWETKQEVTEANNQIPVPTKENIPEPNLCVLLTSSRNHQFQSPRAWWWRPHSRWIGEIS